MDSQTSSADIHVFDNGIKVFRHQLLQEQLDRYAVHNLHEPEEEVLFLEVIKSLAGGKGVYLNIGAAIGYYVMLAKQIAPEITVHAFEPLKLHREYLRDNLKLNGIALNEVHLHKQAVSSKNGKSSFFQHDFGSCLVEELHLKFRDLPDDRKVVVESVTLDEFINTIHTAVDLVQMDVQGFEYDVLAGAMESMRNHRVQCWMVGTHSPKIHEACKQLLVKHRYRISLDQYDTKHQPDGILMAAV